jgi:hypothetical protein
VAGRMEPRGLDGVRIALPHWMIRRRMSQTGWPPIAAQWTPTAIARSHQAIDLPHSSDCPLVVALAAALQGQGDLPSLAEAA